MPLKGRLFGGYTVLQDHLSRVLYLERELRYWRRISASVVESAKECYRHPTSSLGISSVQLEAVRQAQSGTAEVTLADLDRDAYLLPRFAPIRSERVIPPHEFIPRSRAHLQLVDFHGHLGVKKSYRGNHWCFVNELRALHTLRLAGSRVPAIMAVDFSSPSLTITYIPGTSLTELLFRKGVPIRYRDRFNPADGSIPVSKGERLKRIQSARLVLSRVVGSTVMSGFLTEVRKIHTAGFVWNDVKYGNVIVEETSGQAYLVDFEHSRWRQHMGSIGFWMCRKRDMQLLEYFFPPP